MKITINDKQIDLTPEQEKQITEALGREVTVGDAWYEPEEGGVYHHLGRGRAGCTHNNVSHIHNEILKRQRVYRTLAQAKKADDYRIAVTAVQKYIIQNFGEWKPEMVDSRYYVTYSKHQDRYYSFIAGHFIFPTVIPPLKTRKQADQVIANCEEHLRTIFNV